MSHTLFPYVRKYQLVLFKVLVLTASRSFLKQISQHQKMKYVTRTSEIITDIHQREESRKHVKEMIKKKKMIMRRKWDKKNSTNDFK